VYSRIRDIHIFQSLSGEIMQLWPVDPTVLAVRGSLTINRALKIAKLDPSNNPSEVWNPVAMCAVRMPCKVTAT